MPLNPQQRAASQARYDSPLKIIAGAGTGKTETLAARYVELVRQGIAPERIVLLTFTEDAAAEMRERVTLRLRKAALDLPPHALLDLWIATFHGFAMRLLRAHGFAVGLPPTPRLLTEDDQQDVWQTIREAVETEPQLASGYVPLDHDTYRWDSDETWNKALNVAGALRRGGGTPAELAPHPTLAAQQTTTFAAHRGQLVPLIEHCFAAYTGHLRNRGALDYDELLQAALRLIRVRPAIGDQFDVVMVDEFQDTNRPQLALLQAAQPTFSRTTVVGDPRQAIYGWNSARAESIYQFPFRPAHEAGGAEHALIENYRSAPAIVAVANLALAGSELGRLAALVTAAEREAQRDPALADDPAVSLHLLPTVADEAQRVAQEIVRLHERGIAYHKMAVLLRSRTQLSVLLDALRTAGVPFVVNGGSGFYLHWLVRLTSSLLRLIADPADRAAWAHVLESPLIAVPPQLIAVRAEQDSLIEHPPRPFTRWLDDPTALPADLPQRDEVLERLTAFRRFFDAAQARWGLLAPGAYLDWLWQASGLRGIALADADPQSRLVLDQLLRAADDYAASHPADGVAGFAALLQQQVQNQPRVALPTAPTTEAVEVATVHQAKGREWPVVFVFNTMLPGQRAGQVESVLWDEQWRLVISEPGAKSSADDPLQRLRDDLRRRKRNEERAIWYVALTRAQQRLFIFHSGCPLDGGNFADAQAKLNRLATGTSHTKDDEAVHFFHELWQRLHAAPLPGVVCEAPEYEDT